MSEVASILQIVPRTPAGRDGVGDYARILADCLQRHYGLATIFITTTSPEIAQAKEHFGPILLHYVNYGYHKRGVPFWLPTFLQQLKRSSSGRLLTIFHELYASGSWSQSAFWLRPMQMRIARSIAQLSDISMVSSHVLGKQLERLAPRARISVHPVFSNFGEPALSPEQIAQRDPHRWVICGGTELIARSLRSFLSTAASIRQPFAPRELFVVGGAESSTIRKTLAEEKQITAHYFPEVQPAIASRILASCAFGWIDYFERADVPTAAILKSTAFAAYCAHAVIAVFPHAGSAITVCEDALPGPFFTGVSQNLPTESERPNVAQSIHSWYTRKASAWHLADTVAAALGCSKCRK